MSARLGPLHRSILVRCFPEQAYWGVHRKNVELVDEEHVGVAAVGVEVQPRAGGQVLERLSSGERLSWPERLRIAWKPNSNALPPTELEFTFHAEGAGTRVTLEHQGWERLGEKAEKARAGYVEGWPKLFDSRYAEAAASAASGR